MCIRKLTSSTGRGLLLTGPASFAMVPPRSRRLDLFGAKEAKLMFVRFGQAAMMAAIMMLAGNTVWAQTVERKSPVPCSTYRPYECCKEGKCCKDGECCSKSKKCEANCACAKDNKCECCKGDECGCDKCGCKKATCGCCPTMHKMAKRIGIIMIMPASMPLPGACCMEAMGMLPHPPLPPPHVLVPPPVPFPHVAHVNEANTGNMIYGVGINSNCCVGSRVFPAGPACAYAVSTPAIATTIQIAAMSSSDQLEMSISEGTSVRCKKMTVTIGEKEITVSRAGDCVRVRGEELYATAASVSTDGKEGLILEGDVVLRCKKGGQTFAKVMKGEHIELNLSSGAVTIQGMKTISSYLQHPPKYVPPSPPSNLTPERVHGGDGRP